MRKRSSITLFVLLGLGVALALAFFVSPLASSAPDGLERVAIDQGFQGRAASSATAGGPLADYSVAGVHHSWLSTGLSGVIGVVLCFVIGAAVVLAIRAIRARRQSDTPSNVG
jgi:cobalt/nickel transport system permease protein